ncbi:MAG: M12 family metallo-peptidase [Phycisphaerales bacterium]
MLSAVLASLLFVVPSGVPHGGAPLARPVVTPAASDAGAIQFASGAIFNVNAQFLSATRSIVGAADLPIVLGDGEAIIAHVEPFRVVADGVEVRVGASSSAQLAIAMRNVVHLRGEVVGEPGSLVYLGLGANGAAGYVDRGPGRARYTLRSAFGESKGLVSGPARFDRSGGSSQPDVPLCATSDDGGGVAGAGAVPPGVTPVVEIAVDTDYEYFHIFDDANAATEYVATLYGAISAVYHRDVEATLRVVFLRLWETPDDLYNEPDPLGPFRDEWLATMQGVHRDVAQLLTGRRDLPYGGVAWLNATCGDFGFSVTGYLIGAFADPIVTDPGNWDLIVVAHELGHNVGSLHTHSYGLDTCDQGTVQRGSIMSYCHINSGATANMDTRFHRVCADAIESFMVEAPCLASDCDGDGVDDADAIAAGAVADVNSDGIPDACQDCDGDGVLDPIAIATGIVADVDGDGRPDSCEPDCNGNGVPDSLDIANGTSTDAYGDGIPDECEPDCNGNGVADYSDIQANMAIDLGRDALIDACQDCDGDGIPDFVELLGSRGIWVGDAVTPGVRELHPRSGVVVSVVPFGTSPVYDLAIGPDGKLYATSGNAVWRIDRITHAVSQVIAFAASLQARGIAFRGDGILLVARSDNQVRKINVATNRDLGSFTPGASVPNPRDVFVRADGRVLVSCADGKVRQYLSDGTAGAVFIDGSASPHDFVGVVELPSGLSNGGGIVVASRAQQALLRFDATTGASLGRFDVQGLGLVASPWGLALSGDGRAVLAPSATSSSTVNGYNVNTGYTERTYRVYPADAPNATAIVVAPASATDLNGNLIPDECESPLGDLNGDGHVNGADLGILLGAWGSPAADLNGDGTTDAADLAILLGAWTA